jgi:hypothetical protein
MNYAEKIAPKELASHMRVRLKNGSEHDTKQVNKVYETIRKLESELRTNPEKSSVLYELYDMATGKIGFDYPLNDRVLNQMHKIELLENGKMSQQVKDIIDASLTLNEDLSFTIAHPRTEQLITFNKHS